MQHAMRSRLLLVVVAAIVGTFLALPAAADPAKAVAAGYAHTCVVTSHGAVWCWGDNRNGNLGDGTTTERLTPVVVTGLESGVAAVSAFWYHTCAVTTVGAVWCWGYNRLGQLGDGATTDRLTPTPVTGLGSGVVAVAAGGFHTCAVTSGGAVWCWGANSYGQLGDGTTADRLTPVPVTGLGSGVVAVSAGYYHTCAVTSGGAVRCWGYNAVGQLGDGTTTMRLTPVAVSGLATGVVAIDAGEYHTCAVTTGGAALCWGDNGNGQLGDGTTTDGHTPVAVTGLGSGVAAVSAGNSYSCAVTGAGAAWCWGDNRNGQCGDGTVNNSRLTPVGVSGLSSGVAALATGAIHGCAVTSGGEVSCWGNNTHGQIGDGTTTGRPAPVAVQGYAAGDTDTDGDGLPDWWELVFGLDRNSAAGDNGAAGDPDHDGRTNLQEYQAGTHPRGFYTRYFAEGAIIPGFFEVDLALLNVDPLVAGKAWLRYQREGNTEAGQAVPVSALGRRTVRVNDNTVMGTPSYTAFSTVIESDVPVVADRTMIWDDRGYGSHAETSIASPAQTWYLAEGATHSGFELYYLIQNPNAAAVTVQATYLRPSPLAPVVKQYVVGASSRKTIYVNGEGPELAATDVSAKIESLDPALPVIVERAMYLTDGWGHMFGAGHESAAVTAPSTHWFLAEGATVSAFGSQGSFFDLYILIANPNAAASTVTMTYLLPDGTTVTKTLGVAANSRQTVYVNTADPKLADTPVSTVVSATLPVIVERAMWWPGPSWTTWYEAHNSPGTTETGTLWALAEGESGGGRGVETYILIANTSAYAGQVKVTLLFEDGTPATAEATFTLLANSRRTIYPPLDFASAVPAGSHRRYGVLLESVGTTPAQIVVERAMYSNDTAGVTWAAGTNAVATKIR